MVDAAGRRHTHTAGDASMRVDRRMERARMYRAPASRPALRPRPNAGGAARRKGCNAGVDAEGHGAAEHRAGERRERVWHKRARLPYR